MHVLLTKWNDTMQALNNKTIVFIGGGNMAGALIDGLLTKKANENLSLSLGVIDPNQSKLDNFAKKEIKIAQVGHTEALLDRADAVVLAVKPQIMAQVCHGIQAQLSGKLIISVAAGVGLDKLTAMTGTKRIVRTMPNLPAMVGFGATGLYAHVDENDKALAQAVIEASGVAIWVNKESDLHAVTAVAGSAPAYFFYVLEQMIDKAVQLGLSYQDAHILATQTMHGAAVMAKNANPSTLRAKVTSKGGTTHAAISYFDDVQIANKIHGAMQACYDRSVELGNQ